MSFDQCRNGGCENGSITAIAINTADEQGGRWRPERSSCASLWSAASADTKDGHTTSVSLFSTGQNDESDESAPVVPRCLLSCTWHVTSKINHLPRWKLPTVDSSSDSIPGTLSTFSDEFQFFWHRRIPLGLLFNFSFGASNIGPMARPPIGAKVGQLETL